MLIMHQCKWRTLGRFFDGVDFWQNFDFIPLTLSNSLEPLDEPYADLTDYLTSYLHSLNLISDLFYPTY